MCFYEKICELCSKKGISITALAIELGLSKGTPTNWKKMTKPPRANTVKAIADYFGVSVEYLTDDEADENKKSASGITPNATFIDDVKIYKLPLYDSVSAGFGVDAIDDVIEYLPCIVTSDIEGQNSLCIRVWGDSMTPKIEDGDIIQVLKQDSVDSGTVAVVLIDENQGFVKKVVYGKSWIELHSLNPIYPVMRFENEDVLRVRVVGRVQKVIRNM